MAKRRMKPEMERLQKLKADLRNEIAAIQNKLAGVEMAIQAMGADGTGAAEGPEQPKRKRARNVTENVLKLLDAAGMRGLSATEAVDEALKMGVTLERGSVSSLLSRLKGEGTLIYDGTRYRLASAKPSITPMRPVAG